MSWLSENSPPELSMLTGDSKLTRFAFWLVFILRVSREGSATGEGSGGLSFLLARGTINSPSSDEASSSESSAAAGCGVRWKVISGSSKEKSGPKDLRDGRDGRVGPADEAFAGDGAPCGPFLEPLESDSVMS